MNLKLVLKDFFSQKGRIRRQFIEELLMKSQLEKEDEHEEFLRCRTGLSIEEDEKTKKNIGHMS